MVTKSYSPSHNSQFYQGLKKDKHDGKREEMAKKAKEYRKDDSFIDDLSKLKIPLTKLDSWIFNKGDQINSADLTAKVEEIFKAAGIQDWVAWMKGEECKADLGKLSDSLIACSIETEEDDTVKKLRPKLVRGMRLARLLEMLAQGDKKLQANGAISKRLTALVLLPKELFPLPAKDTKKEREDVLKKYEVEKERIEKQREKTFNLVKELESLRNAKTEINIVHRQISRPEREKEREQRFKDIETEQKKAAAGGGALPSFIFGRKNASIEFQAKHFTEKDTSWILTEKAGEKLSNETKKTLEGMCIDLKAVNVREATREIEAKISSLSERINAAPPKSSTVKIGNTFVSKGLVMPLVPKGITLVQPAPGTFDVRVPTAPEPPILTRISVPTGKGNIQPIGYMDLFVVREHILRYEGGDVAHIENILKGEKKIRRHTRKRETEEILELEKEEIKETERDLQSADKFELQVEAQTAAQQKLSVEAGVEAVYRGVSFEVKANAGFAYERATQESNRKAQNISREVIDKTVSNIQERVREKRVTRTRELIEEKNLHEIDNTKGEENITGVYQWVNKVHRVEVVNYGRRLMFEFIVPEPAAFFRHAETLKPIEGVTMEKPEPPVYLSMALNPQSPFAFNLNVADAEARPLQPEDITEDNYLHWVAKYNVRDAETPPPASKIIGLAVNEKPEDETGNNVPKSIGELSVENGYEAVTANILCTSTNHPAGYIRVAVGAHSTEFWGGSTSIDMCFEDGKIPVTIVFYRMASIGIIVEVTCMRKDNKYKEWKRKTYGAIISAYQELKSQYDQKLAAAQVQEGVAIEGRNTLKNREIERTEIKKASISLITGQHFDLFDAMRGSIAPHNYPQMDIKESTAEGRYIQFFEQAFEWYNISYIFYPYFWGRKDNWIDNLHLSDPDPTFEKFLQAGAARVLVPVRPGYEQAILHYLETETGEIWEGGDPPHVEDDFYVSIVDAIKEDQGHSVVEGKGTLSVANDNTLVTGTGSEFTEEDDENREIFIRGKRYLIARVEGLDKIHLQNKYKGATEANLKYELGLQFIGEPWDVTIPTSLVWLQKDAKLPEWKQDENGNWVPVKP